MTTRISKSFTFDAAHSLPMVPEDHKCRRLHGHTYRVELICVGSVGDDGMLVDYDVLAKAWAPLHDLLDHRHLNEIPGLACPTTEILAHFIHGRVWTALRDTPVKHLTIRVYESSTTWCETVTA